MPARTCPAPAPAWDSARHLDTHRPGVGVETLGKSRHGPWKNRVECLDAHVDRLLLMDFERLPDSGTEMIKRSDRSATASRAALSGSATKSPLGSWRRCQRIDA
jgi:hypothetical protein